jgi:hypothetical protein
MPDANYAFSYGTEGGGAGNALLGVEQAGGTAPSVGSLRITIKQATAFLDRSFVTVMVFR